MHCFVKQNLKLDKIPETVGELQNVRYDNSNDDDFCKV